MRRNSWNGWSGNVRNVLTIIKVVVFWLMLPLRLLLGVLVALFDIGLGGDDPSVKWRELVLHGVDEGLNDKGTDQAGEKASQDRP